MTAGPERSPHRPDIPLLHPDVFFTPHAVLRPLDADGAPLESTEPWPSLGSHGDIERDWTPIGSVAEEGFTIPFYERLEPPPLLPPSDGSYGGLGEGEKATLAVLGVILVVHLVPMVALVVDIVRGSGR